MVVFSAPRLVAHPTRWPASRGWGVGRRGPPTAERKLHELEYAHRAGFRVCAPDVGGAMNRGEASDLILDSPLASIQRLILFGYMRHMNSALPVEAGDSFPGSDRLARYAGCSERAARSHRAKLIASGVLVVVERSGNTLRCRIDFDALASFHPAPRSGQAAPRSCDPAGGSGHPAPDATRQEVPVTRQEVPTDPAPRSAHPAGSATEPSLLTLSKNPLQEPSASDGPKPDPLWKQVGCPKPSAKVKPAHMTRKVLEVYAFWHKRYDAWRKVHAKRSGIHSMTPDDLLAIKDALKRDPEEVVGPDAVADWPIERLVKAALAYPMAITGDADRGWVQKKPAKHMRPSFTLRNGSERNQWFDAARCGVLLADSRNGKTTPVNGHPGTSKTHELWEAWKHPFDSKQLSIRAGIPEDRWLEYVRHLRGVGTSSQIRDMHNIDRKAARQQFGERVAAWDNERQETRP